MSKFIGLIISISLIISPLLLSGCLAHEGQPASGKERQDLPPIELPEKGHPKLDSQLNQLVHAEERGETASFAEQSNIELVDGAVRVIIECVPGQLEAATEAVTNTGAKLETSYENLLQVVVTINRLGTLADAASIQFIRLPQYASSAAINGVKGLINSTEWQT